MPSYTHVYKTFFFTPIYFLHLVNIYVFLVNLLTYNLRFVVSFILKIEFAGGLCEMVYVYIYNFSRDMYPQWWGKWGSLEEKSFNYMSRHIKYFVWYGVLISEGGMMNEIAIQQFFFPYGVQSDNVHTHRLLVYVPMFILLFLIYSFLSSTRKMLLNNIGTNFLNLLLNCSTHVWREFFLAFYRLLDRCFNDRLILMNNISEMFFYWKSLLTI